MASKDATPSFWGDMPDGDRKAQCKDILALLRRGPRTSLEIAKAALKYTSRVSDLRKAGHVIRAVRTGKVWTYTLLK